MSPSSNGGERYKPKAADLMLPLMLAPGHPLYDMKKTLRHLQEGASTLERPDELADISENLGKVAHGDIIFGALDEFLIGNPQEYIWYIPGEGLLVKGDIVSMLVHPLGFDIFDEEVEGEIDGSNTGFATSARYVPGTLCVIRNGVWLKEGTDFTEGEADALVFNVAPQTGDVLRVNYTKASDKSRVYQEMPSGTIDGSNTDFTVANSYVPGTLEVFLNGVTLQFREDFYGGTKSFEMTTAPAAGDDLVAAYQVVASADWTYQEVPSGAINGSNQTFDLSEEYEELAVFHNGVKLSVTTDYTETDADTFTLNTPPLTGDTLWVIYKPGTWAGAGTPVAPTHEETITAETHVSTTTCVTGNIQGGTNQLYVVAIGNGGGLKTVSSVTGGGLSWSEAKAQCSGRSQVDLHVWWAYGSPGSAFPITVTLATNALCISVAASRFSGVDSVTQIEDATGHNSNGENGACSGGTDTNTPEVTTGSTKVNSIHYVATQTRDRDVTQDADYTEIGEIQATYSAGTTSRTTVAIYEKAATGDDKYLGAVAVNTDWACIGLVIRSLG